jgi:hypothetical protein
VRSCWLRLKNRLLAVGVIVRSNALSAEMSRASLLPPADSSLLRSSVVNFESLSWLASPSVICDR